MYGIVFSELKKFTEETLGDERWKDLLEGANLRNKIYLPMKEYPDEEMVALVSKAAEMTQKTLPDLLETFGCFIVPDLTKVYAALIRPEWKTLDLIEHTENTIHRVIRSRNPGAKPPEMRCSRIDENKVKLIYTSQRKLCSLGKGIIKGVALHYGETLFIKENSCMMQGAGQCEMMIERITS